MPSTTTGGEGIKFSGRPPHGRRSRRDRGTSPPPQNLEQEIVPQILSCCKILSTRLLALQCRKCVFSLYSKTFIVNPAMRPPRIPVRSTRMVLRPSVRYCPSVCPLTPILYMTWYVYSVEEFQRNLPQILIMWVAVT